MQAAVIGAGRDRRGEKKSRKTIALHGQQVEPTLSKIELEAVAVKGIDAKDQIDTQTKVVKIDDTSIKLS
jgi:hypothetical protein